MKITLSFARALEKLIAGEEIHFGSFHGAGRKLLLKFIEDGVLDEVPVGIQRKKVRCANAHNLSSYVHHKFEIPSLQQYILFLEKEDTLRREAVIATSDSKFKKTSVFEGFLINVYEEIEGVSNGNPFRIKPTHGAFTFIHDYKNFSIPADIVVVGVEGHENFREIERQQYLFRDLKALFVWRYQNSASIAHWLNVIPNNYLHFGDFDLKGLHIYVTEFRNKIGASRSNFFIPENLDPLMFQHGEKALYEKQYEYLKAFDFESIPEIRPVLDVVKKYKKGLAQEVLISEQSG